MGEIFSQIIFFLFILPFLALSEGYEKFKKFMKKNNYSLDWAYTTLVVLIFLLIIVLLLEYGYR